MRNSGVCIVTKTNSVIHVVTTTPYFTPSFSVGDNRDMYCDIANGIVTLATKDVNVTT